MRYEYPQHVQIAVLSSQQLTAVYAVLALGVNDLGEVKRAANRGTVAVETGNVAGTANVKPDISPASDVSDAAQVSVEANTAQLASNTDEVDAGGHPWSADLHASTRAKTKEGFWRMKPGATRPDPLPGFPVDSQPAATATEPAGGTPTPEPESAPASQDGNQDAGEAVEEDDEFAAFRAAAEKSDAEDAAAKASVPAREWTDADLSSLCNAAAQKLGSPVPVKELIAEYVEEGEIPHSRNIAPGKREAFAKAIETKAGIEFAG